MKEATGEVSMTVITIVILAILVGFATWIFGTNGPAKDWISKFFNGDNPATTVDQTRGGWAE